MCREIEDFISELNDQYDEFEASLREEIASRSHNLDDDETTRNRIFDIVFCYNDIAEEYVADNPYLLLEDLRGHQHAMMSDLAELIEAHQKMVDACAG